MSLAELKNSHRVTGSKQVRKAITQGLARKVFIAGDAEPHIVEPIIELCRQNNTDYQIVESMNLLGEACGIEVGSATAALLVE
ncbi:L7Ae/L30e/S12e/Gadd45 family ribosomal protein [Syntrophomonas palmitatica]|uniref:L7Ae/L30e/S12e/Gadd45 family ribosomal protein n=1 Tax=Syntrophomonas palmitatica TaxID=402877 RepID=UPI0006D07E91|nr:ribosomal L7Ae/L30e/S12e/Gadd45 family protein [Syntrophomonas palmitatica]